MKIKWYGHSCFRISESGQAAVTDPFPTDIGYHRPRTRADIVTVSHPHPNHNDLTGFKEDPFVIDGPGEYEISGIFVNGIRTYHDKKKGAERGYNTVYVFRFGDTAICHLGDLGHIPNQSQVDEIGEVDVLLTPVGGAGALNASMAAEVISLIEPGLVIPMHYATDVYEDGLDPVEPFLKAMGVKDVAVEDDLTLRSTPSEDTEVILLSYYT